MLETYVPRVKISSAGDPRFKINNFTIFCLSTGGATAHMGAFEVAPGLATQLSRMLFCFASA